MKKRVFLGIYLFLMLLAIIPLVPAENNQIYHLKLLAVQEIGNQYKGSDADLYLELREGSGRVFLETYPLTKMDTQVSTRFAKEVACKHFNLNCDQYDFIYTIKAKSNIIGGPSAGAAIASLTTIAVLDLKYDENIAITGTINSGGIIGPVGGVKEKVQAASEIKLKKVLIPIGTLSLEDETHETKNNFDKTNSSSPLIVQNQTLLTKFNLTQIQSSGLKIIEVMNLDEVVFQLTGKDLNHKEIKITENPEYSLIMKNLQEILCRRTEKILTELSENNIKLNGTVLEESNQKKNNSEIFAEKGDYYSSASFCFGNNILLRTQYYLQKKVSPNNVAELFDSLEQKNLALDRKMAEEKIQTISDLQTLMIVKERVEEVKDYVKRFRENRETLTPEETVNLLSYAEERYFSAVSWVQFFSMEGKKFVFDKEKLKNSCLEKISEAEERYQYASIFIGELPILNIREEIDKSHLLSEKEDYPLCLMTAIQAKAEADAILSSMGLDDKNIESYITAKSKAVERVIFENSQEGTFPIMGYSYYQYANSLKEQKDKYISLVYLEYALEMSDLGIYFPEEKSFFQEVDAGINLSPKWYYGFGGLIIGAGLASLVFVGIWFKRYRHKKFKPLKKKQVWE